MGYTKLYTKRFSQKELAPIQKMFNEKILPVYKDVLNAKKQFEDKGFDPMEFEDFASEYDNIVTSFKNAKAEYTNLVENGVQMEVQYNIDAEGFANDMQAYIKEINKMKGYENE